MLERSEILCAEFNDHWVQKRAFEFIRNWLELKVYCVLQTKSLFAEQASVLFWRAAYTVAVK